MALIDKASLLFVPSVVAEGKAFNVLPSGNRAPDNKGGAGYDQTRADFDFDRGSNTAATRIGSDGLLKKYRENLLTYSNVFSNGVWAKSNLSVASSNGAWEVTDNTTSGSHYLYWGGTTPSSSVLTLSVEAKAGSVNYLVMRLGGFTYAYFNLSNGTLGAIHPSFIDAKIEETSDGFYRCSATILTPSSGNASVFYPSDNSSNVSYTGTGAVAITIKNAQLETGLVATDYLESTSVTGKAGVLIDLPRIDYSSGAGALLLEPQRVNLYPYSEYTGSGALTGFGTGTYTQTITNNYSISPEGVKNAIRFQSTCGNTINDRSGLRDLLTLTTTNATLSFYAKSNTDSNQTITFHFAGGHRSIITTTPEWQRFDYTEVSPVTSVYCGLEIRGTITDTDVDVSVYGFQMEQASYPTSYIPNHGTSGGVTRAADSCSVTGASDVIGQTEGTLYAEFDFEKLITGDTGRIFCIGDNTITNRIGIGIGGNGKFEGFVVSAGTLVAYLQTTDVITELRNYKMALAYKANDFALYINGVQIGTDNGGAVPTGMNKIFVGLFEIGGSGSQPSNPIKQTTLFKERLSNAELAALTA